ncbi:hepcidin-like [Fundulus heteroclitus]|uniref:hepcidin-like n=1 Tax=Fundulus heteroclitus TaxID=8078 RepID=UPI00165A1494|nr:hepcidin-like [Fundulus heteroclitus]
MKAFTLAVAVAIVVTVIGVQEGSADLIIEGPELMDGLTNGSPVAVGQDMPEDSWKMPYDSAQMRRRRCRFCCGCCPRMRGCGICCRF